ncbi:MULTISPECIES: replication initiation negative regulator SeqA [Pseudomonadati]|uniref:Negative modulator of initiation of replication n=1 Tax=Shewanella aestuarii TaxID=1028752 RepID=A0ABT0KX86_9GAMM|nr:replication initiation negative regulator SeqA [Shewanella aestuarii]MCL1116082.1 replication initiation negative regulator SeqA [Shewanella aestuarii]GGN70343.1 negative modulator of initiation of replication [Shewanella aestuarii]
MKYIEIDEELYRFIASKTERIGESASEILRRLLGLPVEYVADHTPESISQPGLDALDANARDALFNKAKTIVEQLVNHRAQVKAESSTQVNAAVTPEPMPTSPVAPVAAEAKDANAVSATMDFKAVINEHLISQQKGAVGRFMFLLDALANQAGSHFDQVLQIQGKGRLYFARSKQALLDASQSANPKEIGQSGYWVTTNNNTAKKQTILSEVLIHLGCDAQQASTIAKYI